MTIITKKTPLHIPSMDTFLSDRKFFEITIPPRINLKLIATTKNHDEELYP